MMLINAHCFLRLIRFAGLAQRFDVTDHFFKYRRRAPARVSALVALDMDFDLSVGADGDFKFALRHGWMSD